MFHLSISPLFRNFVETSDNMAKPVLIQTIDSLSKKIDSLLENQKSLFEKVKALEKENQRLILMHDEDNKQLEKAQQDIEFLTLSHRLADSPEALIAARNKISQLIRTIDSCILMIKEN